ncbi:uncharacterized protein LOC117104175 [Anneissia japonica]|uniref:uncharacterized protein LOC117104175 n=1 Tax=Anneissia japonica TaxID=1529436 RepID=UPI001425B7E9|nr:uncharacterized protein LOC117104175 [Anneissia japonica]
MINEDDCCPHSALASAIYVEISFEATVNGSNCGVAIDDIVVKNGHVLPPDPTTRSPITTTIQAPLSGSGQPKDVIATTFPEAKQDHHTMWILIAIIIALAFVIIVGLSVHCCIYRRNRSHKKADEESVDADAKRKRFQESKSGGLTTSGYMTLTKTKSYDVTNTADLGAIDLTITSPKPGTITFGNGKSLPRLPSLPDEAKKHRHSINMDVTYDYVDDVPADSNLPRNLSEDRTLSKEDSTVNAISTDHTQESLDPPVYFTLSPTDQGYSHLSEYSTMPDVVKVADDSGLNYKPSLVARNVSGRRKSSLSSLREKLSKGLSNASNEYEELKSDDYYEEVNVECQL